MRLMTWKAKARHTYALVCELGLWTDELADHHYTGAGGAVHPSGKLHDSLRPSDMAWEQLFRDCIQALKENE